jgi:polyisoprenyl-phosphate glycosyltransferase
MIKSLNIVILIPVFDDFICLPLLLKKVSETFNSDIGFRFLIIDDGSFHDFDEKIALKKEYDIKILTLKHNVGHQRSITIGLCSLLNEDDYDYVLVMDGDGEDNPKDATRLIQTAEGSTQNKIIFARRDVRSEPILFKLGYFSYRLLFRVLTGKNIKFGNFSLIPKQLISRITGIPQIWNHYAASILASRIPYEEVSSVRSTRIVGRSKMNLFSLIVHGLSAISVFLDLINIRLFIALSILLIPVTTFGLINLIHPPDSTFIVQLSLYLMFTLNMAWFLTFYVNIILLHKRKNAPCIPSDFCKKMIK